MKAVVRAIFSVKKANALSLDPSGSIGCNRQHLIRFSLLISYASMNNPSFIHLLEYIGHDMSPVSAVIAFFVFGYIVVGLPVHFRQGPASRDIWGTAAGVTMAAVYAAFLVCVYPMLHHPLHLLPPISVAH